MTDRPKARPISSHEIMLTLVREAHERIARSQMAYNACRCAACTPDKRPEPFEITSRGVR